MNKSGSNQLKPTVNSFLKRHLGKNARLLIGVSGGVDSMTLLYLLHQLKQDVLVVHINYGLRGEASGLDQELVEGMCSEWNFDCHSFGLDYNEQSGGNIQNWARQERYRIFRELKKEYKADAIVTAHHYEDQLETILQKLLRGAGPQTWQGMQVWDGEIFRPLLNFSKDDIYGYAEDHAIPFREDETNTQSKYARNFLRLELRQQLDEFFPGWRQNIERLSELGLIAKQAVRELAEKVMNKKGDIEKDAFFKLDEPLRSSVLKYILEKNGVFPSKGQLEELQAFENLQPGRRFQLDDDTVLMTGRNFLFIKKEDEHAGTEPVALSEEALADGFEFGSLTFSLRTEKGKGRDLYLDASLLNFPLTLRTWETADKFIPFGMNGTQKISDHLTNRKIPVHLKEKTLVLSGSDSTIYAIIFPEPSASGERGSISNLVACTDKTDEFLVIKFP